METNLVVFKCRFNQEVQKIMRWNVHIVKGLERKCMRNSEFLCFLVISDFNTYISTYRFQPFLPRAFHLVSREIGRVVPGPKRTCQSRGYSLLVFFDHLIDISSSNSNLGRLRCIQSRDSKRTQICVQQ